MMNPANSKTQARDGETVLGTFIDALSWNQAIDQITSWGSKRESRTVCLCNVHSSVTAINDAVLSASLSESDMALPDGAPVAWMLRRKGFYSQTRIAGPDLMLTLCSQLDNSNIGVFLFGSSDYTLHRLETNLKSKFPHLAIKGILSPKYGHWSYEDEKHYIETINNSGAGIVFIGLGCPKQEIWMAKNRENIHGVMLGVGAAFDFHAGTVKRAPMILQRLGAEWLHRLLSEPKRLWKRYFTTNTRFIILALKELWHFR